MGNKCCTRYKRIPFDKGTVKNGNLSVQRIDCDEQHLDFMSVHRVHFKSARFADKQKSCDICSRTTAVMSWHNSDSLGAPKRRLCMNCVYDAIVI